MKWQPGFLGIWWGAIAGGSVYRKSTFLLDSLGKQILPDWLTIEEHPHLLKGLASTPFDSEGVRTERRDIIKDGILTQWLLTSYSARKLGLKSTGHAGGIHNWRIAGQGAKLRTNAQRDGHRAGGDGADGPVA